MNRRSSATRPEPILQLQRHLEEFRSSQSGRVKLPDSLWEAAVELARQYGIWPVAHPLRLDYMRWRKRLGKVPPPHRRKVAPPFFSEVVAAQPAVLPVRLTARAHDRRSPATSRPAACTCGQTAVVDKPWPPPCPSPGTSGSAWPPAAGSYPSPWRCQLDLRPAVSCLARHTLGQSEPALSRHTVRPGLAIEFDPVTALETRSVSGSSCIGQLSASKPFPLWYNFFASLADITGRGHASEDCSLFANLVV